MEPVREPPWAEHEKSYLLAEIIKSSFPSQFLLSIIRDHNVQPKWNDIALPQGRSLRSSQMAYNDMNATFAGPDYRQRPQLAPIVYPGPEASKKRPLQPEMTPPMGLARIQPRPPQSYPQEFMSGPAYNMSPLGEPANKKKRGRPTKEEARARAEAAAARGEIYPAPRKGRPSGGSIANPSPPGEPHRPVPMALAPSPMAITPQQAQTEETRSEESSGKKKRSKPTPLELDKPPREFSEMESPLAYGQSTGDPSRSQGYQFTPISAPLRSEESRDRDIRMEGVDEAHPRTTTPHSFKDTVGI